jgi:asparagine synthetase B (glutamine-hydrolysing)
MSDFLVSLDKRHRGNDLLSLIKKPYGKRAPEGQSFDYSWGSVAVLNERLACNGNIIVRDGASFAWVGDLVVDLPDRFAEMLMNRLNQLQQLADDDDVCLETDSLFARLNGTFAIVFTNAGGLCIVTDPLSFVPVYKGKNRQGDIVSLGTHPDSVAVTCDMVTSVDTVSAAEFLNTGGSTFPSTMYTSVKQLNPGSLFRVHPGKSGRMRVQTFRYWSPPRELATGSDIGELAEELAQSITSAAKDRCGKGRVAVALSGGLDSRLILAAIPKEVECVAVTFGDCMNRELKTAQRVAKAYDRQWFPLLRGKDFLEHSLVNTVKIAGCENRWISAHAVGFVESIEELGVAALLGGNGMDSFVKGYDAKDVLPMKRLGGILPNKYVKVRFDYEDCVSLFWRDHLKASVLEEMRARRRVYYDSNLDPNRTSMAELLLNYPHSQNDCASAIFAERRLLPLRTCAADRRILDFGFKCPFWLKLDNKILFMACGRIYGKGRHIPNANDGVRPCSNHWSRLGQRATRKLQQRTSRVLEKFGKAPHIQHSWHDYQTYWDKSALFEEMVREYGRNLERFDDVLFEKSGWDLLKWRRIDWRSGFRLLQIAVWLEIIKE